MTAQLYRLYFEDKAGSWESVFTQGGGKSLRQIRSYLKLRASLEDNTTIERAMIAFNMTIIIRSVKE